MSDWLNVDLNKVGVETKQVDLGNHVMYGQTMPLPNAIPGKIGDDKNKKTVLIYGHFDVQSASLSDGWASEPFVLTHSHSPPSPQSKTSSSQATASASRDATAAPQASPAPGPCRRNCRARRVGHRGA
ncbi:hypothetical protein B0H16DRAFT_529349 [Mycena metata]|uniref:Glutamate carboxypeptidase n=1 Tax=Mycena metata TaxID=1033252 RepID=A0AAD7JF88_9AGAR|nr:hypothetical protein B0H16DRAFT_529349 [Mycena metata]